MCVCVPAYLSRNLVSITLHIFTFRTCTIIGKIHVCICLRLLCLPFTSYQKVRNSSPESSDARVFHRVTSRSAAISQLYSCLRCPSPCSKGRIFQGSKYVFVGRIGRRAHKNLNRDLIIQPLPLAKDWQKHFGPQTWLGSVQNFSASPILICFASETFIIIDHQ